ncbi:MAG: ABC transporter ATP-binding protein [Myxococcales bacterium]|nr:ABC transporter ATP-binding protein [Myxococcales bacterium]|tara:strand:+ start:3709 stop:4602 length:894 start_codon:yes stop_codon:yes gene_type:complete
MVPIQIEAISRAFGNVRAVNNLSLRVPEGEIFGFLGPNGAGKTTTIRTLLGLLQPDAGSCRVLGHDCWEESHTVKAKIGFLPGDLQLPPRWTGHEFFSYHGSFRKQDPKRLQNLIDRFDMDGSRRLGDLSKGNQQKVAIIGAFMHEASLVILDEPTSGLDPLMQQNFLELIEEERDAGRTVFLSSHHLQEVERVADQVGIIRDGTLVAVETVNDLKRVCERTLSIDFSSTPDLDPLLRLDNVSLREQSELRVILGVKGSPDEILTTLATMPVKDFVFPSADLESIFMHYYDSGSHTP